MYVLCRMLKLPNSSSGLHDDGAQQQDGATANGLSPMDSSSPGMRSRSPSVSALVGELGLGSEQTPTTSVTPLAVGQVRAARQQSQHQPHTPSSGQASHDHQEDSRSVEKQRDAGNVAPRKPTMSKGQANILAAARSGRVINRTTKPNHSLSVGSSGSSSSASSPAKAGGSSQRRSRERLKPEVNGEVSPLIAPKASKRPHESANNNTPEPDKKRRSSIAAPHRGMDQAVDLEEDWKRYVFRILCRLFVLFLPLKFWKIP